MATKRITVESFLGGDHGALASVHAPAGTYSGRDVICYADGNVGPRCGVQPLNIPGMPEGKLQGLGYFGPGLNPDLRSFTDPVPWIIVDDVIYSIPDLDAPPNSIGGIATPGGMVANVLVGAVPHITDPAIGVGRIPFTAFPGTEDVGGTSIILFGERLLWAGASGFPNRVFYSDPLPVNGDPPTFDANTNYFDVGFDTLIVGMWSLRDRIYIAKSDGTWWTYTGVPGVSDNLRRSYDGQSVPAAGAVMGSTSVWFVGVGEDFPSYFNGSTVQAFPEQEALGRLYGQTPQPVSFYQPAVSVIPLSRRGDILFLAGVGVPAANRASLLLREERWSRHSVRPPIGVAVPGSDGFVLLSDGGSTATAPQFYTWRATGLNRPPTGGTGVYDVPATDPTGDYSPEFTIPEVVAGAGQEVTVRKVFADFRSYNETGLDPSDRQATVTVTPTRMYEGSPPIVAMKPLELGNTGTSTGASVPKVADIGQQASGRGALVTLSGIRACSIERLELEVEIMDRRP